MVDHKKYVMFVGRWQPLHNGHIAMISETLAEGKNALIAIRDTPLSESNPYSVRQRQEMIMRAFGEFYGKRVASIVIPDIEAIHYGRGVGYEVKQVNVPNDIQEISATKIRAGLDGRVHEGVSRYIENLGSTFWLTGRPCAGKSTLAKILGESLENTDKGYKINYLDGDDVREGLCKDLGFSDEDRKENMRRVGHAAKWANQNKNTVLASFVSPTDEMRSIVREILGDRMRLIYVKAPLEVCEKRDVKGMYAEARLGKRPGFTGVDPSAPFEEPKSPDMVIETDKYSAEECVKQIVEGFDL